MKGLTDATVTCLDEFYGNWTVGGQVITYGLKTNTEKEYVGLPRDTWSMENFTIEPYNEVLAKIRSGEITIDANVGADLAELAGEHIVIKNDNAGGSLK